MSEVAAAVAADHIDVALLHASLAVPADAPKKIVLVAGQVRPCNAQCTQHVVHNTQSRQRMVMADMHTSTLKYTHTHTHASHTRFIKHLDDRQVLRLRLTAHPLNGSPCLVLHDTQASLAAAAAARLYSPDTYYSWIFGILQHYDLPDAVAVRPSNTR